MLPGVRPGVSVSTAPAMSARSSSRKDSRKNITDGERATSGETPLASRPHGLARVGFHSCLPLDVPVPATVGLGISVLTVVVPREEPPGPPTSAGVGGGGTRTEETGIPAPAGAGGVSVDVRRGDVSPGEDVGVGIVGGSAIALLCLLSSDLRATQCGAPSKPQPTTWNGRSGIWRHNYTVRMACPTAKTTRIKLTRPSPRLA